MTTNQAEVPTPKRPCKVITLQEKLAILRQLESGTSRREVEQMFNCSQSTISRVLMGKESLLQDAQNNVTNRRESLISYKELDQALSQWAREMKSTDSVITSKMAQQKAEELAKALGHDLRPSPAWLYKWKERENIKFAKRSKDPEEILKEFLDKREKSYEMHRIRQENFKRIKLTKQAAMNQENFKEDINKKEESFQQVTTEPQMLREPAETPQIMKNRPEEDSKNETMEDSPNKPRQKREYVKRLPMIDASGVIYRSRKEKTFLTLLQKLEILQRLKNGERRHDLIAEYKLSQSAMSQIVTDEEKILKLAAGGQNLQMKRIRGGIFKDGEAELNAWVKEKMEMGENLTRTQIKNHAKEIAERLNIDFKASTGWLEKWKVRMNLDFNENQVLQRKVPQYVPNEEDYQNHTQDISYDPGSDNEEYFHTEIKTELREYDEEDYADDMETNEEFSYNEVEQQPDIKPELLTPQQFYLQTIMKDSQQNTQTQQEEEEEEQSRYELETHEEFEDQPDIKPFQGLPPHLTQTEEHTTPKETLHEKVLKWLNKYNIPPTGASELLQILQPHLKETSNGSSSSSSCATLAKENQPYF
ncbi:uncharacterized protein ACRADG_006409 [Cochliomyia hominivorax]